MTKSLETYEEKMRRQKIKYSQLQIQMISQLEIPEVGKGCVIAAVNLIAS